MRIAESEASITIARLSLQPPPYLIILSLLEFVKVILTIIREE